MPSPSRQTVFISHANPADNDVAGWLAAKLAALGYSVWVDVEKLRGGESIWRTIEPVLRNDARCLILILSRSTFGANGLLRQGVSNEMEFALMQEREHPEFVFPWFVDDLPFSSLPIQLQNRMSISERKWSTALKRIRDYLDSLQIVPSPGNSEGAALLQRLLIHEDIGVTQTPAIYDINRLECRGLPQTIYSVEEDASVVDVNVTSNSYNGRRLSFNAISGSSRLFGKGLPKAISLAQALESGIPALNLTSKEVAGTVVELARKEFYSHLRSKGLVEQGRINRSPVFYFNSATVPSAKVSVKLPEKSRRSNRSVWGAHKDIYWHLGIEARITAPDGLLVTLSPHILFTKDGMSQSLDDDPVRDRKIQHRRRRAIAKLWFNDKWRGFFYPFLSHIQDDDGLIRIELDGNSPLLFAGTLSSVTVPATHVSVKELLPDDLIDTADEEVNDA